MTNDTPVPVLLVDNRRQNLFVQQEMLRDPGVELVSASSGEAAIGELLGRDFAVVVLDVEMDGMETARLIRARERSRGTPILFLTAQSPGERTREGYALGAADYLHEPISPEALRSRIGVFAELFRQRRNAEGMAERLRLQGSLHARHSRMVELTGDAVMGWTMAGTVESWNPAAERILGWSGDEIIGRPAELLVPRDQAAQLVGWMALLRAGRSVERAPAVWVRRDGTRLDMEVSVFALLDPDGCAAGAVVVARDVTETRRAETLLRERDERLRQVMHFAPTGVALVALDGRWISVNPALCTLLGYAESELQELTFQDITHPDDLAADLEQVRQLVAGDITAYEMEKRYYRKDGTLVWGLLSGSVVRDDAGAPLYFIAQVQDVSARHRAAEELRSTAEHLEVVVRTQREIALAGLDLARVMEVAVERTCQLTGATGAVIELAEGDEMVYRATAGTLRAHQGLRLSSATSISGLCARTRRMQRADDCDTDPRVDRAACRRVGARSMLLVPLLHEDAPAGVLKVISGQPAAFDERDMHTLQLMEGLIGAAMGHASAFETNQALLAELDRSNRELRDFANVASHDLQEPLRKIQAFGDRLRAGFAGQLGEQGADYVARMQGAAARMQALIQDLLAYSRTSSKAISVRAVDLAQVAREVISDLSERIRSTAGVVEVQPLPTVQADPTQMRQLLQNLVGNALKFHRDGVPPVVRVHAEPDAEGTRLVVADNGIGFQEQYADRIFTPFQRLHGRGEYEGTGMGLAICRKIAERHGGRITVASVPGQGTTFTVFLPATPAQAQAAGPS